MTVEQGVIPFCFFLEWRRYYRSEGDMALFFQSAASSAF